MSRTIPLSRPVDLYCSLRKHMRCCHRGLYSLARAHTLISNPLFSASSIVPSCAIMVAPLATSHLWHSFLVWLATHDGLSLCFGPHALTCCFFDILAIAQSWGGRNATMPVAIYARWGRYTSSLTVWLAVSACMLALAGSQAHQQQHRS